MNSKNTKRARRLAMPACVAFIGTTFAWFTDTASTGVNKIQSGSLDVELEYSTDMVEWQPAATSTKLFSDSTLWEPGVTRLYISALKMRELLLLNIPWDLIPRSVLQTA